MTIEELRKDMVAAMKSKDKVRKDVISSLIAAVKNAELITVCVMIFPKIW